MQGTLTVSAILVAMVVAAYAGSLTGAFQFDDWNVIVGDPRVQSLQAWWQSMPGIRPLLKLSYALNFELDSRFSLGPAGFRSANILLHAGNTVLVYQVLSNFAVSIMGGERSRIAIVALTGAVVFALHPVQTEAVTYISGRSNALMALPALIAVFAWQRSAISDHKHTWQWLSALSVLLACAIKETAVVVPLALWLAYVCGANRAASRPPAPWPQTSVLLLAVGLIGLSPVYRSLLAHSLQVRGSIDNLLLVQPDAILYLAGQLLRFDRLNADPMMTPQLLWAPGAVLSLALIVLALVVAMVALRRRPWLAFGLLWFFVWLAPTNSLLARNDLVNDRQLYLAIIGPAWLLGVGLARLQQIFGSVRLRLALGALCILMGVATMVRNRVYADEIVFWQDVTAKSVGNPRAHNNLGIALAHRCRDAEAREQFKRALRIDPDYFLASGNLAMLEQGGLADPQQPCAAAASVR